MRILVATDFSEPSLAALGYARALTYALNGEGLLLHVVEEDPVRRYVVGRQPEDASYGLDLMADPFRHQRPSQVISQDLCEEAQWKLSTLLPPAEHDRFRTLVVVGKSCEEIVRVARDWNSDLIMLGGRRRTSLIGFFRRNLAEQVTRRMTIPVIAVWHSGHVMSNQAWARDTLLWGWLDEHRTGKQAGERKSKARSTRVPSGV